MEEILRPGRFNKMLIIRYFYATIPWTEDYFPIRRLERGCFCRSPPALFPYLSCFERTLPCPLPMEQDPVRSESFAARSVGTQGPLCKFCRELALKAFVECHFLRIQSGGLPSTVEVFKNGGQRHRNVFRSLDCWIRGRQRSILRKRRKGKGRGRGFDHYCRPNRFSDEHGLLKRTPKPNGNASLYEIICAIRVIRG